MSEILFYLFIYPLYSVLNVVILWLYDVFSSYGLSIIFLSILINLLLLKLTQMSNNYQEKYYKLKTKCDNKVKEFKKIFRGAELAAYTRILYRQNRYHPILALVGLSGLAIQIPFFLAMYFLVNNTTFLQGQGFLWISDLSKPDSFLGIHILPILMSVFTLLNVFISSRDLGARIQGSVIAIIFLILLYEMPSALVLYWSMNMFLALFWAIWRKYQLKLPSIPQIKLINSSLNYIFTPFDKLVSKGFKNSPDSANAKSSTSKICLLSWIRDKSPLESKIYSRVSKDSQIFLKYRSACIFALLNIFFIIFIYLPFGLYSTDLGQFDIAQIPMTFSALVGYFLLFSLGSIYISSFFYHTKLLRIMLYGIHLVLIVGLIYTFVLVGNYGAMDHFILQNPAFFDPALRTQKYLFALFAVIIAGIIGFLSFRLAVVWKIVFFAVFILNIINVFKIYTQMPDSTTAISKPSNPTLDKIIGDTQKVIDSSGDKTQIAPYVDGLLSYSKHEKNIVVFVLDMFSGSHTPHIFKQFSEFTNSLDGFILFDNALSTTNSTIHSMPTLIGGEYYSTYNMNKRGNNLDDEIVKAFGSTALAFVDNGYSVSYFLNYPWRKSILKYTDNKITHIDNGNLAQEYYIEMQNLKPKLAKLKEENKYSPIIQAYSFGLFRFSPELYFRPRIYNYGLWLLDDMQGLSNALVSTTYTSTFWTFTHFGNTNSTKPTFKFLHSMMTHVPFNIYFNNGKCEFLNKKSAWDDTPKGVKIDYESDITKNIYYQQYDTEACAISYLQDYVKWLKDNGIYDNTQIFVLSDHGGDGPINVLSTRADVLLMYKDFNARGKMKVDSRLMANYDIASIFCENLPNGCPNVPKNILTNYPKNRTIIHSVPSSWIFDQHKVNQWNINRAFIIKDNMYKKENWKEIEVKNNQILD